VREPGKPRRSPAPEERQADAERSRRQLLTAAFDEFAAKGYAGARVHKQLINYYFGGKEGLYRALQREWLSREATFDNSGNPAVEVAERYMRELLADPRVARLVMWRGLSYSEGEAEPDEEPVQDLSGITSRQEAGELDPAIDPRCLLIGMMSVITGPVVMPDLVRKLFGVDTSDPDFQERYVAFVRDFVRRLEPR
jgi:TetR/AcrR family transcriptional regulator